MCNYESYRRVIPSPVEDYVFHCSECDTELTIKDVDHTQKWVLIECCPKCKKEKVKPS